MAQDLLLLSDGSSHLLLSDGVSRLLLSTSSAAADPDTDPFRRFTHLDGRRASELDGRFTFHLDARRTTRR